MTALLQDFSIWVALGGLFVGLMRQIVGD